jgi:hypothetical protein
MRYKTTIEPRDVDDNKVYDAECFDTALDEPCFRSVGWPLKKDATARLKEHIYEHAESVPMRELEAYRKGMTTEEYEKHVEELTENNALPTVEWEDE